ncbi:MAG: UDP-N-acetylmuramate--L-alanine ligase [Bdellovibrionales bacterium]|jgi:UDP-N-acetylmuramate--alanine ligase|nr:UDP-N-acetylmuramate--L-alanine ligase [Bdellovibrionales bacterium]MBT3526049.1 UDP-N-acetylmuramate--L-alanine ligase [Bdellovibrionales bacterium]MBT7668787.1 UDP-N-acetylmuramate--L-alanine ligase [Bdellovibrionales bacterium]MBT7767056.1 UDP-N-acetylmuramate--L-alanine ligase [Bdellovibrionales bacterium]
MFTRSKNVRVHFIGIGGIGMSGIAEILLSLGFRVQGSDNSRSANVERLISLGAEVHIGHAKENIGEATVVTYSSAIKDDNPELVAAQQKSLPLMRRAEMLAELMRLKKGLAIAGTHGKTTTTSILATIFQESQLDPTYIIGGIVSNLKGHAKVGKGEYLIAEADESDGSFLLLNPIMSVITNIDNDHLDHYGSESKLEEAFIRFANRVPFYGYCALNIHDSRLMGMRHSIKKQYITFGIGTVDGQTPDYMAKIINSYLGETTFEIHFDGKKVGAATLNLPGEHNILNAMGAIALSHKMGLGFDQISNALSKFAGVGRRFQRIYSDDRLDVIDDYAHHPTAISSTLEAIAAVKGEATVVVVFEPHRYTRTRDCWDKFFHCFNHADKLYISPIYAASEPVISGINSERLALDLNRIHPHFVNCLEGLDDLDKLIASELEQSDRVILVTLGAGSIGLRGKEAVERWSGGA